MIELSRFYRAVRQFAANRQPWQEAVRYDTLPDEEWDLTLVSQRIYGNRNESLAVQAAAGLDHPNDQLTQRRLVLPTPAQLEALKQQTGYSSLRVALVR
ncbi:hypothetical protein BJP27_24585 (plasmid) [Pseudomonas oryzihabitans]|nr:hypothetical protein BJP27_23935 [Pseudomonas psychrotolerans]APQ14749.1 hypothetical protein BJP27_24585 [Pseudomonas psychrotolerans]